MRIVITGAAGYIGRHVVKQVLDMGHEVTAVDFRFDGVDARAARCNIPIFNNAEDIYCQLGKPDVCIHLAWRDGFIHNSPAHMCDLSDHITFCNNMMQGGLPYLSVMGTMHEVGYWEGAIDENTPCNPLSQYGVAKNAMRQSLMLSAAGNSCHLRWLRAYYITGDDVRGNSIFAERVERFISDNHFDIKLIYGAYPDRPYDSPGEWGDATKIHDILIKLKMPDYDMEQYTH